MSRFPLAFPPRLTPPPATRRYEVWQVDSFTSVPFTGNPAGVVLDAAGMTDHEMQLVARELNNPETAFVLPPDDASHDVKIRYFTPITEVPLCGHATIAAHVARATKLGLAPCSLLQRCGAGDLPVGIGGRAGAYRVTLTQAEPTFAPPLTTRATQQVLRALRLPSAALRSDCPVQVVSTGHAKLMIGVETRAALMALRPDAAALVKLSPDVGANGYFLFALESEAPDELSTCRMFAPAIGIDEDPVTGNGHGPLGAYLVHHRLVQHDGRAFRFRSSQGHCVGRRGRVDVSVDIRDDRPLRTHISGDAVPVFKTTIELGAVWR